MHGTVNIKKVNFRVHTFMSKKNESRLSSSGWNYVSQFYTKMQNSVNNSRRRPITWNSN